MNKRRITESGLIAIAGLWATYFASFVSIHLSAIVGFSFVVGWMTHLALHIDD